MAEWDGQRDEFGDYLDEAMRNPQFARAYAEAGERAARRRRPWLPSQVLIGRRVMWWAPWNLTRWWVPKVWHGSDEWCNDSICFTVPPFGCVIVFWRWHLRDIPCAEEWEMMDAEQRADYGPCGYLHGGRVREDAHRHWRDGLCDAVREGS